MPEGPNPFTRRRVLAASSAAVTVALTGCLDARGSTATTTTTVSGVPPTSRRIEVRFHRASDEDALASRERVELRNGSEERVVLAGYTLRYSSGHRYEFEGLALPPDAGVLVVSQGTGDGAMKTKPPTFVRDANLGTNVLADGRETVTLVSPDGEAVLDETYDGP